mmetsp:Transcript_64010/g.165232  ORF Transcript_64010/g.165232 Transcript_64010/m.165232 type:complete len:129 (+) Transcript_64010:1-387(+)
MPCVFQFYGLLGGQPNKSCQVDFLWPTYHWARPPPPLGDADVLTETKVQTPFAGPRLVGAEQYNGIGRAQKSYGFLPSNRRILRSFKYSLHQSSLGYFTQIVSVVWPSVCLDRGHSSPQSLVWLSPSL